MSASTESASPGSARRGRWLFGPAPDLLLGCGLGWMGVLALQAWMGDSLARYVPGGLIILALALPHYGATLLRVYESSEERRRYALLAVWGAVVLAALFVGALYSALLGSLVLTLYLTWSPWHYSGQNYGICLMLLGRRGVSVTPRAKRLLYASFGLSFALTFLAIHGVEKSAAYAPVSYAGTVYSLMPLGIPRAVAGPLVVALAVGYVAAVLGAGVLLWRSAPRARDLGPAAVLAATQALWFSVPVIARYGGLQEQLPVLGSVFTAYGFLWIAGAHSVQYLWVTTYYAQRSGAAPSRWRYLGKTALAGYAIWTLPALVFAPGLAGGVAYDAGLGLMVAAVVNLHHFMLDGAIWKLREGRVARLLVRPSSEAGATAAPLGEPRRGWLRPAPVVWAVGALCLVVGLGSFVEKEFGYRRALVAGDLARARTALERLAWVGRDSAGLRATLGRALAKEGRYGAAERELRRALEERPTAATWRALAGVHRRRGAWPEAARASEEALALEPDHVRSLYRAGRSWLEAGRPERAEPHLARAAELAPEQGLVEIALERARRAQDDGRAAASPRP